MKFGMELLKGLQWGEFKLIFNFLIITLLYLIISFIPCGSDICNTIYNGKPYLANMHEIFSIKGIFLFFLFLIRAFLIVLNNIIIHNFSVCHSFLYYLLCQMGSFYTIINDENNKINAIYFIIIISYIIGGILVLIFLEIIEINICGISYNTKQNIIKRSSIEIEFVEKIKNDEDIPAEEEVEKEEDDRD